LPHPQAITSSNRLKVVRLSRSISISSYHHLESLYAQPCLVKPHKQRQSCLAQAFLDGAFQLGTNAVPPEGEAAPVGRNGWSN
jgi:hypothetical protein